MFKWIKPKNPVPAITPASQPQQSGRKEQLIREAMTNAKTAREAIGEETLAKVREMIQKQQQAQKTPQQRAQEAIKSLAPPSANPDEVSPMEQAKKILLSMEPAKLAEHLRYIRDQDKQTK